MFTLMYRRGSFLQSEVFGSFSGAVDEAYSTIVKEGYSGFTIKQGGRILMHHSQIEEQCQAARAATLRGEVPARWYCP